MQNTWVSVINLDRRPDRMAYMSGALQRFGAPFTRIRAVDAKNPANNWLIDGVPAQITGIRMGRGEHAVHVSHWTAWRDAAKRDLEAVIVLEDDAVLSSDFARLLEPGWIPADADIVKLESYWGEIELGPIVACPFPERQLRRLHSVHLGAAGYLVTSSGLEKLTRLISPDKILDPIDRTIFDRHSPIFRKLTIYQVVPAMVRQAEFFDIPEARGLSVSDLAEARNFATKNGVTYGNAESLFRRSRRLVLRARSRLSGRFRIMVDYR